ncbi:hypothetical protein V8E36_008296 [Tilletia maclaganii]
MHSEASHQQLDFHDADEVDDHSVHNFEIREDSIEKVKKRFQDIGYPMLEEYDFRNDQLNLDLEDSFVYAHWALVLTLRSDPSHK